MSERVVIHVTTTEPHDDTIVGPIPNTCCGQEPEQGFGLAGGGYGPYAECLICRRFYKAPIDIEDDE